MNNLLRFKALPDRERRRLVGSSVRALTSKNATKEADQPIVRKVRRLIELRPHAAAFIERVVDDFIAEHEGDEQGAS